jgi:hypothetical protein
MRKLIPIALMAAAALAGSAQAQLSRDSTPPTLTDICLDVSGGRLPIVCDVPSSRLDKHEHFCRCPRGTKIDAPVCGPGETPPGESAAFERARRQAARDGSLVGDAYEGRAMCERPRNPLSKSS